MRLIFYIFLISQLSNIISVFAEKFTKDSPQLNPIKWEKIEENNSYKLKKIIWKSYKNDDSYFQNSIDESDFQNSINESSVIKKPKNTRNENKYNPKKNSINSILEIEPYLPLNEFLDYGDFQTSIRWKASFDGGSSGGTGQQNPSFILDYGLSDSSLMTIYFSEADDNLYNSIDSQIINYHWQNYALSFKKKLIDEEDFDFRLSLVTTLEYWKHTSGSEIAKSIYNQHTPQTNIII